MRMLRGGALEFWLNLEMMKLIRLYGKLSNQILSNPEKFI